MFPTDAVYPQEKGTRPVPPWPKDYDTAVAEMKLRLLNHGPQWNVECFKRISGELNKNRVGNLWSTWLKKVAKNNQSGYCPPWTISSSLLLL